MNTLNKLYKMIKRFGGEQEAWNINGATLIGFYTIMNSMLNKEQ